MTTNTAFTEGNIVHIEDHYSVEAIPGITYDADGNQKPLVNLRVIEGQVTPGTSAKVIIIPLDSAHAGAVVGSIGAAHTAAANRAVQYDLQVAEGAAIVAKAMQLVGAETFGDLMDHCQENDVTPAEIAAAAEVNQLASQLGLTKARAEDEVTVIRDGKVSTVPVKDIVHLAQAGASVQEIATVNNLPEDLVKEVIATELGVTEDDEDGGTDPAATTEDGEEIQLWLESDPDANRRPNVMVTIDDGIGHRRLILSEAEALKLAHGLIGLVTHVAKTEDAARIDAIATELGITKEN